MKWHIYDRMIEARTEGSCGEIILNRPESLIDITDAVWAGSGKVVTTGAAHELRPPFPSTCLWYAGDGPHGHQEWLIRVEDLSEDDEYPGVGWFATPFLTVPYDLMPDGYARLPFDFGSTPDGVRLRVDDDVTTGITPEQLGYTRQFAEMAARITVVALQFLNCVNVPLETVDPPPPKVRRKRARRGLPHYLAYQRLIIPGISRPQGAGSSEHNPPPALHVVRGHFKHYTDENPLFGKLTGTYWWHPHARGSESAGIVRKTYKVAPWN